MTMIYKEARRVVTWIGPEVDPQWEFHGSQMMPKEELFSGIKLMAEPADGEPVLENCFPGGKQGEVNDAFFKFVRRPWFSRR